MEEQKKEPKKLTDFLSKEDARVVKEFAYLALKEFGRYIKTVAVVGSRKTGYGVKPSSDFDVIVIVDDTDVERMPREEVKARLFFRLTELGLLAEQIVYGEIKRKIHVQAYLLTEWWKSLLESNPVILTMLDTGFPVVDRGFFLPLQILYKKGQYMPSRYGIDTYMKAVNELLKRAEWERKVGIVDDLYWAVTFAVNSLFMELGYKPLPPKKIADGAMEILVKKHNLLREEDVETIRKVVETFKGIEHREIKALYGKDLDELVEKSKDLIKRIENIIEEIRKKKGEEVTWRVKKEEEEYKMERPGIIEELLEEKR